MKTDLSGVLNRLSGAVPARIEFRSPVTAILLMVLCLGANIYVRLFPAHLPGLRQEALLNVVNAELKEGAGNYTGEARLKGLAVSAAAQTGITRDPTAFSRKVDAELTKLKGPLQDESGLTYLLESDPYAWAVWTENVLRYGHPGNRIVNGKSHDSLMLAPRGLEVFHFTFLFYLTAHLYKAVSLFSGAVSFQSFLFYVPVFYSACFLALFYLFVRRWSTDLAAFFAVMLAGFTGEMVQRGCAGWYDFDMLSLSFAVLVGGCLAEAFRDGGWKRMILGTVAAAFFEGVYAMTWLGWWFMLVVAAGFFISSATLAVIAGPQKLSAVLRSLFFHLSAAVLFYVLSFLFAGWMTGVDMIERVGWLRSFLRFNTALGADIWPNVFYTISELGALSLRGIASRFYGVILFSAILVSVAFAVVREWRSDRRSVVLILLSWFAFMFFASFRGNRFVLYLAVPAFAFFGIALAEYLPGWIKDRLGGILRILAFGGYVVLLGFLVRTGFASGIAVAESIRPVMNDAWYEALSRIERETPRDAIINSWWDFGSWFRYYGKRGVIFDGQSQGGQLAYWMARAMLETDEEKAVRILRMLDLSGTGAFFLIQERIRDPYRSKTVLDSLLASDEATAREILASEGFEAEGAKKVLDDLFRLPAPAYFVVEGSMVGKMASISFIGNWDARKLMIERMAGEPAEAVRGRLTSLFGLAPEEAERLYQRQTETLKGVDRNESISTRSDFFSSPVKGEKGKSLIRFDNGVVFDPVSPEVLYYSEAASKFRVPKRVVLWREGVRSEMKNEGGGDDATVLIAANGEEYRAVLANDDLIDSLFVRLYLLGGSGLKHFNPFHSDDEYKIYIYEIDWGAS
ncbi:MAG: Undecaprenyl-diphosphooligosaccharide--protein glycotransferase [Candidatus Omnitrophica bacterium ADurb.Bin314]|nr:MAG: Undecaprenyl-diphosphooligosaccharide--protein glycotransferase [Candidatus Omnitrophica bacterium ADurb.Bin314]HOE68034.1 STT3 domain-containing protein [Candidatus Omnitrophota bacterium]